MVGQCLSIAGSVILGSTSSCSLLETSTSIEASSEVCGLSNATSPTLGDFNDCVSEWFYESKTNFHGMHDELVLPWWFGLFCLNYSIGGITALLVRPKWMKQSSFPYTTFAFFLIFFQGPLSFLADYMNMTNDSMWHTLDRLAAVPLLVLELSKTCLMIPHTRRVVMASYITSIAVALVSFLMSQQSQKDRDTDGFVFWHNMWHMHPLIVSVLMSFDMFVLGEYDPLAEATKGGNKDEVEHPLLSTLVMNDPKYRSRKTMRTRKTRKES